MLRTKAQADAPNLMPPRPTWSGPWPYDRWFEPRFEPSEELASLYERREQLWALLEGEHYNQSPSRQYIDIVESQLKDLEREITERELGEKEEHKKRLVEYRRARKAYEHNVRLWKEEEKRQRKRQESLTARLGVVDMVRRDIERAFKPGADVPTERVHWRLLPPGESSLDDIRRRYDVLRHQGKLVGYDEERLNKAFDLGPNKAHVGSAGFDGYIIFTFDYTSKALMECPKVGNAIYVIGSDWERWSRMSKQELMVDQSGEVIRIPHQGDWFGKVKQELGIC